jgi:D-serine deaminase-like pyridoxal phosphate-dependent protein
MIETIYDLRRTDDIASPALVYYEDIIRNNIREAIRMAGSADRLWPHVKTHKMPAMLRMQMDMGILRFKTATIAESEMAALAGAPDILMAYPLVGPAMDRFLRLTQLYPRSRFWAIGDDIGQLRELGKRAKRLGFDQRTLADVDLGMHRTGVAVDRLDGFYREAARISGLKMRGMHSYDGHNKKNDLAERMAATIEYSKPVHAIRAELEKGGLDCGVMVMGGSPTFPCHAATPGIFLSPGTLFVHDYSGMSKLPDMKFTPGGVLLSRVVSLPCIDRFTIDLGYKGIASDPAGVRGVIANMPETEPIGQNEEHWIFRMLPGSENKRPKIGDVLYIIPTHICPTSALYSSVLISRNGEIVDAWDVTARNRKITV